MKWVTRSSGSTAAVRGSLLAILLTCLAILIWQGLWVGGRERLALAEQAYERQVQLARVVASAQLTSASASSLQFSAAWLDSSAIDAGLSVQGLDLNQGRIHFSARGDGHAVVQWLHRLEQEGGKILALSLERIEQALHVRVSLDASERQVRRQ